jgi:hypothetical protein
MNAISLAAMIAAGILRLRLVGRYEARNAFLIVGAGYLNVVIAVGLALPAIGRGARAIPGRRAVAIQNCVDGGSTDHVGDPGSSLRRLDRVGRDGNLDEVTSQKKGVLTRQFG